ncbi:MAG TPA: hypothetical protein VH170_05205, partial [Chthoniobacterales bacterium]|nr:hypothetical protein [Chthoniobacterales bacterium]
DEFYQRVRDGYLEFAKWQKDRVVVLKGWEPPEEVAKEIWKILSQRFPQLNAESAVEDPKSKT